MLTESDARARLLATPSTASDGVFAARLADYFTASCGERGYYYLSALAADKKTLAKLPRTSARKNTVSFKTQSRKEARGWIMLAALSGHTVIRSFSAKHYGGSFGTIEQIRHHSEDV